MSELSFANAALWPWLLVAPALWFGVWGLLRSIARTRDAYGAALTEPVPSPWGRATRIVLAMVFLLLAYMEPRYGEEKVQKAWRGSSSAQEDVRCVLKRPPGDLDCVALCRRLKAFRKVA